MEGKTRPSWTIMVQYCLHSLLSMELEMGMQLLLLTLCQKKHPNQVRILEIDSFGAYDVSVQYVN